MKKYLVSFVLLLTVTNYSFAQAKNKFDNDVQTIKNYDKIYNPLSNPILFVGSSSIRKWDHLQMAFGKYNVINRGIGGAVINDIVYYLDDLVFAYHPRQIVLYVGENDLPSESENVDTIVNRTIVLYKAIRAKLPDVPLVYIAMKPSPSRDKYMQKCNDANHRIQKFLSTEKNTQFIDVFSLMLKDGKSRPELFVSDMLHMKPEGYTIWEKAVKPALLSDRN